MTDATPLLALGLVLLVAALLGAIARRLGLPAIVAYLLVGLVVGPFTPGTSSSASSSSRSPTSA